MKIKRKTVADSIAGQIVMLHSKIEVHEKDRKASLKSKNDTEAAYHHGRISGLVEAINCLQVIKEQLEQR
jgi:hypothetical protein